jgi:hypothetical protein
MMERVRRGIALRQLLSSDGFRIPLYLAVIFATITLREPWMIALQAGMGGVLVGMRLAWRIDRNMRLARIHEMRLARIHESASRAP